MKFLTFKFDSPEINIYPLTDWHVGARQCDVGFILNIVERIKNDPLAHWLYLGDGGEVVTPHSKGKMHEQLYDPGEQLTIVTNILKPIANKGLFGIRGNHGNRTDKDSAMEWDEILCKAVGIPYAGISALTTLRLQDAHNHRTTTSLYAHHGVSVAVTPAGKIKAATKPVSFILADIILTGHSHGCGETWPPNLYATVKAGRVQWLRSRVFACGSAYDGRTGYAEEKLYSPIAPSHLVLHLKQRRTNNALSVSISPEFIQPPLQPPKDLGVVPACLLKDN